MESIPWLNFPAFSGVACRAIKPALRELDLPLSGNKAALRRRLAGDLDDDQETGEIDGKNEGQGKATL